MAKKEIIARSQKESRTKTKAGLTAAQEMFAARLAAGDTQRQAYYKAYPNSKKWQDSTVDSKASTLFSNGKVKERYEELTQQVIKKVQDDSINEGADVIKAYQRLAKASITDFIEVEMYEGVPRFILKDISKIDSYAIKKMTIDQVGNVIVELYDKKPILDKLAEIYGVNEKDDTSDQMHISVGGFSEEYLQ